MKYVAPEDMVVYSIDEVFMDATGYLETYGLTARELARKIILDVLNTTGITATAGIGTNLYLAKPPWTLWPSTFPPIKTGCASPNWTSRPTAKRCGDTPR